VGGVRAAVRELGIDRTEAQRAAWRGPEIKLPNWRLDGQCRACATRLRAGIRGGFHELQAQTAQERTGRVSLVQAAQGKRCLPRTQRYAVWEQASL